MEFQQLLIMVFERGSEVLDKALEGLTQDELSYLPTTDCNSIGWLTWHLTRAQDSAISRLTDKEQLWIADKWYSKFNRNADSTDNGVGHSSEEVSNFQSPDTKTLLDYHHAVLKRTNEYISKLSASELEREVDNPRRPTVSSNLLAIISDSLQHVGQIAYLRGMLKGKGWYGR